MRRLKAIVPVRGRGSWVITIAVLATLASIALVATLQSHADSSRAAQVALGQAERQFDALQSVPYDEIGTRGDPDHAALLRRMQTTEDRIERTIARLRREFSSSHLVHVARPYRASTAVLEQIRGLLARGAQRQADSLGPVAGQLQRAVDRELARAGDDYARRALSSKRLATFGSAAAILILLSLFGVFYLRSRKAHAATEKLSAENAQFLLQDSQLQVIQRLALAGEYRDDDTGQHTRRVGDLSRRIGAALHMPKHQLNLLREAAPLHDVGKIGIPDSILLKPGPLTPEELDQMRAHAALGAEMLAGRNFPLLEMAEQIALTHHERWDGHGYPRRLSGAAIPLVGRIVAVADAFDALTHSRPYKQPWTVGAAVAEISNQAGRQFDPEIVRAFMSVVPSLTPSASEEDHRPLEKLRVRWGGRRRPAEGAPALKLQAGRPKPPENQASPGSLAAACRAARAPAPTPPKGTLK
jgi:HD-GYP domain-containing protein (c-di-GMP phosphodiesterase class II)